MEPTTSAGSETLTFSHSLDGVGWLAGRLTGPILLFVLTVQAGTTVPPATAAFAVGCLVMISARPPSVQLDPTGMVVRNALLTYRIPRSAVKGLDVAKFHEVRILTPEREVRCSALRKEGIADLVGKESRVDRAVAEIYRYRRAVRAVASSASPLGRVERTLSARPIPFAIGLAVVAIMISAGFALRGTLGG